MLAVRRESEKIKRKEFSIPKKFLISAAVILLLFSGALANIGQVEGFSIGAINLVGRFGGLGFAEGGNIVMVGQSQTITTPHMTSTESQFVGVAQYSAVSGGIGSKAIVVNTVDVKMGQGQIVSGGPAPRRHR